MDAKSRPNRELKLSAWVVVWLSWFLDTFWSLIAVVRMFGLVFVVIRWFLSIVDVVFEELSARFEHNRDP